MPSSRSGFQSGATRRTSARTVRTSSTTASCGVDLGPVARGRRVAGALRRRLASRRSSSASLRRDDVVGDGEQAVAGEPVGVGARCRTGRSPSCQTMGALRRLLEWRARWCSKKPERSQAADVVAPAGRAGRRPPARRRRREAPKTVSNTARTAAVRSRGWPGSSTRMPSAGNASG